ncbi:hypothetical protein BC834DRAFT_1045589 [Gloeopeniophorella convolvens]|nr:hypothetical protein BC834DRAFT_1045589 [Gloeopeniophorella convolvens]
MESLPDVALLEIFDSYRLLSKTRRGWDWKWHVLAQVCHRWRQLVLTSPERLKVRRYLAPGLPISDILRSLEFTKSFPWHSSNSTVSASSPYTTSSPSLTPRLTHLELNIERFDQTHVPLILQVLESVYLMHELEDLCLSFWPDRGFSPNVDQQDQAKTSASHPVLSEISFLVTSALFEYFIYKLDAPALELLSVDIIDRPPITIPSLSRFMSNLVPRITVRNEAHVSLTERALCVETRPLVFDNGSNLTTVHGDRLRTHLSIIYNDWFPHLPTLMATILAICQPFAPALVHVDSLFIRCDDFIDHEEPWVEVPYAEGWDMVFAFFPNTTALDVEINDRRDVLQALQGPSDAVLLPNLETITFLQNSHRQYDPLLVLQPLLDARSAVGRHIKVWHRFRPPDDIDIALGATPGQPPNVLLN